MGFYVRKSFCLLGCVDVVLVGSVERKTVATL